MNRIGFANYKLSCTKDCSSSFALISFSNLISAIISNVPLTQLNISALEFVCSQMPSLRGSYFLFYLETSIYQHPIFFEGHHCGKDLDGNRNPALGYSECTCFYGTGTSESVLVSLNLHKFLLWPLLDLRPHGEGLSASLSRAFAVLDYELLLQQGEGDIFVGKVFLNHLVLVECKQLFYMLAPTTTTLGLA